MLKSCWCHVDIFLGSSLIDLVSIKSIHEKKHTGLNLDNNIVDHVQEFSV
jgi:hypothetical protein